MSESFEDFLKRKEERRNQKNEKKYTTLRRTPLRKVSDKQRKRNNETRKAYDKHYNSDENRKCFLCSSTVSLSVHHIQGRGINSSNENTFVTLCLTSTYLDDKFPELNHNHTGGCHGFIHANPKWARENNLL